VDGKFNTVLLLPYILYVPVLPKVPLKPAKFKELKLEPAVTLSEYVPVVKLKSSALVAEKDVAVTVVAVALLFDMLTVGVPV
jgi:hypothetical protein